MTWSLDQILIAKSEYFQMSLDSSSNGFLKKAISRNTLLIRIIKNTTDYDLAFLKF